MKQKKSKEHKRLTTFRLALYLCILIFLIFLPSIIWYFQRTSTLVVTVYDKSVPTSRAEQHLSLSWFLKQFKYPDTDGKIFNPKTTYLGYHPDQEDPISDLTNMSEDTDLLYIADTYGIYRDPNAIAAEGERNLIWGGSDNSDATVIRSFLNREKSSTLIAEYNTFATPTPGYVQSQLYELIGTRWTGWTGLYIYDLANSKEIPSWITTLHQGPWEYQGSGIILYNTDQEVLVLRTGEEISDKGLEFSFTDQGTKNLGLEGTYSYRLLFDITEPMAGTEVLGNYTLDVTDQGKAVLDAYGLPTEFPAIQVKQTANHKAYYFSGNWAYRNNKLRFSKAAELYHLMERFSPKDDRFFWDVYIPMLKTIFSEAEQRLSTPIPELSRTVSITENGLKLTSRVQNHEIQLYENGTWEPLFLYGVNLGIAMPGKWFTEFPQNKSLYYRWLTQMGELGVNTVRIYTLLDPQFYDAFALYNRTHPNRPLYLLQEVWPEEYPEDQDYLKAAYTEAFFGEINRVVDAVHGNITIAERQGRAYGTYTSDISDYLIGYLVGRELEPEEVEATDHLHEGFRYEGEYIGTTEEATPTESWLAHSCDYLLTYETETYHYQHPVSLVNWPTLDYLDHESERDEEGKKVREYNDRTTVNINHLNVMDKNLAGLFGSYHIYPNYPDFMNNDPLYDTYYDEQGRFRYGGYLKEFMAGHQKYPAVVAEFGLATGMGNAHTSPDGYNHGGLDEETQGEGIIRMFDAMQREGYSGGIIFEWMDEWAKKAWTTEPYMIPYDRHNLWHNAIDPEQNYGLLAYEAIKPIRSGATSTRDGEIRRIELRSDASFLWVDITLASPLDLASHQLLIGIDTLDHDRGEVKYVSTLSEEAQTGLEYLVVLDSLDNAHLLATEKSNYTTYHFSTSDALSHDAAWEPMTKLINKERALEDGTLIPAKFEDSGALRYGPLLGATNHWNIDGTKVTVRIPWTRINVSDPSSAAVLDDNNLYYSDPLRDQIATTQISNIRISTALISQDGKTLMDASNTLSLALPTWDQSVYSERLKQSYTILQSYFTKEQKHD